MTTTTTLFELSYEAQQLDELLTLSEGELTEAVEARMTELTRRLVEKADSIAWVWKSMEARAKALKDAEADLAAKRKIEENKLIRLKTYITACLQQLPERTAKGSIFTLAIQANGGKRTLQLVGANPDAFDPIFRKTVVSVDTDVVREALERQGTDALLSGDGTVLASLLPRGESVRLR